MNESEKAIIKQAASILGKIGGKLGGSSRSAKKRRASRNNGKLGGRPRRVETMPRTGGKMAGKLLGKGEVAQASGENLERNKNSA